MGNIRRKRAGSLSKRLQLGRCPRGNPNTAILHIMSNSRHDQSIFPKQELIVSFAEGALFRVPDQCLEVLPRVYIAGVGVKAI